ncbi:MAG: O-antigen ligase family protein [Elusimicrobia bacterium]|nr:O-antigen ligase family protein [Elusimicrobiota bacterium]
MTFVILCAVLLLAPVAIYTGTKDNFLIKNSLTILLMLAGGTLNASRRIRNVLPRLTAIRQFSWPVKPSPVALSILFFLAAGIASVFNANLKKLVFSTVILHACFAFVYLFARDTTAKQRIGIYRVLFISGFIVCVYGIAQFFGHDFLPWGTSYGGRVFSSFGNPNFFAGYLVVLIPFTLAMCFYSKTVVSKILWVVLCSAMTLNLALTETRGAWVSCIFAAATFVVLTKLYRKKRVLLVISAALAVTFFSAGDRMYNYFVQKFNPASPAVVERLFKYRTAWQMIKRYPYLGIGAGNMKVNFALYQASVREKAKFRVRGTSESNVHNEYLQIWAETGTLGLAGFLMIFFMYFRTMRNNALACTSSIEKGNLYLLSGISAGVAGFMVYCLSNFPLRISPTAVMLFLFLGLGETISRIKPHSPPTPAEKKKLPLYQTIVLDTVLPASCLFLVWKFVILPFSADVHRARGDTQVLRSQTASNAGDMLAANTHLTGAIVHYEKSIALDYENSERTAFDLGEILRRYGRLDEAIAAYRVSINVRNYGEVYNCLANCYYLKGEKILRNGVRGQGPAWQLFSEAIKNWEVAKNLGMPEASDQEIITRNIEHLRKKLEKGDKK